MKHNNNNWLLHLQESPLVLTIFNNDLKNLVYKCLLSHSHVHPCIQDTSKHHPVWIPSSFFECSIYSVRLSLIFISTKHCCHSTKDPQPENPYKRNDRVRYRIWIWLTCLGTPFETVTRYPSYFSTRPQAASEAEHPCRINSFGLILVKWYNRTFDHKVICFIILLPSIIMYMVLVLSNTWLNYDLIILFP